MRELQRVIRANGVQVGVASFFFGAAFGSLCRAVRLVEEARVELEELHADTRTRVFQLESLLEARDVLEQHEPATEEEK